jgi:predicted ribosomally synthesized peptide with SipW-like signal peptide
MSHPPATKPVDWSIIGALGLLVGCVVLGLVAQGASWLQSLVALGFGAGVLLLAWMWRMTAQRQKTTEPGGRNLWAATVFVCWLAAMGVLAWWSATSRFERGTAPTERDEEREGQVERERR